MICSIAGISAFATVQAEPLGAHVFDVQEFFEPFGLDHLVQDRLAAFLGELDFLAIAFDPFLQPGGLFGVRNMHVLQREGATVGPLHNLDDLPHRGHPQAQNIVDEDRAIHIGIGEAVCFWIQFRMCVGRTHAQRIQVGGQMAPDAIGPDQHQRPQTVQHGALALVIADLNALCLCLVLDLSARRPGLNPGPILL